MSLKSIDLQMAFSRNSDAGNIQQQMMNKPLLDQAALAAGEVRHTDEQRTKSAKLEQKDNTGIKEEARQKSGGHREGNAGGESKQQKEQAPKHPFKGQHIDLSL